MKEILQRHLISREESVREALTRLDRLGPDAILFVIDENNKLIGSLTDGDLRRGFIGGLGFQNPILDFIQINPVYIKEYEDSFEKLEQYKTKNF